MNPVTVNSPASEQIVVWAVEKIAAFPTTYHNLKSDELTQLVKHAVWCLLCIKQQSGYYSKKVTYLSRDLLVDSENSRVSIISKKFDDHRIVRKGTRMECSAIELAISASGSAVALRTCYINNEEAASFNKFELEYTKRYAEVLSSVRYESPKGKKRICFTIPYYNYCLRTALIVRGELPWRFLHVCKTIGSIIKRMHDDGVVHGNISLDTILCSTSRGVTLTNFAISYAPGKQAYKGANPFCYGTAKYSGPESLTRTTLPETVSGKRTMAKAADMYALGCTLWHLAFKEEQPCVESMGKWWVDKSINKKDITEMHTRFTNDVQIAADQDANSTNRLFMALFAGLLNPRLADRMKIDEFLNAVIALENTGQHTLNVQFRGNVKTIVLCNLPPLAENFDTLAARLPRCELFGLPDNCPVCNPNGSEK